MQERVRNLTAAFAFIPAYVVLDWASYFYPLGPFYITPWNPQPGLAVVLVMLGGLPHALAVGAAIFIADWVVRDAPGGLQVSLASAALLATGYTAIGMMLRHHVADPGLRHLRDLVRLCAVVAGGTALIAIAYVGSLHLAGLPMGMSAPRAWLRFWVGDLVGVFVTVPLLLVAADRERRATLARLVRSREAWMQCAVLVAMLALIFALQRENAARLFYLLFIPLVWIALRWGMTGAVVAATIAQTGVLAGMQQGSTVLPILELQALVGAFTAMGLFLGVVSDERRDSEERLRESLRLAAAGEMAGAIAHEVNQPLTALGIYGESARMLLDRGGADRAALEDLVRKMVSEVRRTADVMQRLRDLFASGTTRLEEVPADDLLDAARRIGAGIVAQGPIALEVAPAPPLPVLHVDRVQVELVLRNLIANAAEALRAAGRGGRIRVEAQPAAEGRVLLKVSDDGPGIAEAMRERLFQPFVTGKARGMGLGLAVSRAIAEAHGGSLDAVSSSGHTEFRLVLPCLTNP